MKKLATMLCAALILLASACGAAQTNLERSPYGPADELAEISITVKEGAVGRQAESVMLTIKNLSDEEFYYGAAFEFEKQIDGLWYAYPPEEEIMFIEVLYILEPYASAEETIILYTFYGELEPGTYRVVKSFGTEDGTSGVAFGVFTVN
jgi:hypothetical protein